MRIVGDDAKLRLGSSGVELLIPIDSKTVEHALALCALEVLIDGSRHLGLGVSIAKLSSSDRLSESGMDSISNPWRVPYRAYWRTALHGAAAKGDTNAIRYLASSGANVNAVDRSGDSPLELALTNHQEAAANVLAALGAKRIEGDQAQRDKAIHDKVQERHRQHATPLSVSSRLLA